MKKVILFSFLFIFWSFLHSQNKFSDSLDQYTDHVMNSLNVPGFSIAIVDNDSLILLKGYGTKIVGKTKRVNENTLFAIGSITKTMTALAMGILVDRGQLNWDDKVVEYLTYFKLYDPYVTEEFTIRDLLTHRSGLKNVSGGTLWYGSDLSREEVIRRLHYLDPVAGFREKPNYQNVTFLVAGEIIEEVSGMGWDEFIHTEIFDPLGMKNSVTSYDEILKSYNVAVPHIRNKDFKLIPVNHRKYDNCAPAISVYSTAVDMAKYMRLFLNNGVVGSDTIISTKVMKEILKPQIIFPFFSEPYYNEFSSYGLGWWLTPKQGHKIIEHSGGVDGMGADLKMVPDLDFGVVVLSNSEDLAQFSLTFHILAQLLNDSTYEIHDVLLLLLEDYRERVLGMEEKLLEERINGTLPSLELNEYAGTFYDEMYGDIFIKMIEDELFIEFSHTPAFSGSLSHWHFDTFRIDWTDPVIADGFVTFILDSKGKVSELKLDQQGLLDVDFGELGIRRRE